MRRLIQNAGSGNSSPESAGRREPAAADRSAAISTCGSPATVPGFIAALRSAGWPLVKLFASVLRREPDGCYWLVTPAERGRIEVEDVPFLAVALTVAGEGRDQQLIFRTNLDDIVTAGPDNPLRVETAANGEPAPYILVRDGLEARIARPVFYELVELGAEEHDRARPPNSGYGAGAGSSAWANPARIGIETW